MQTNVSKISNLKEKKQPFLSDVRHLRARARANINQGAITPAYKGNVQQTIDILQAVLATEIVCVLRYTMNAITAEGISSESVRKEFAEHAAEEQEHVQRVAVRINQLGGKPDFDPQNISSKAASQYVEAEDLVDMIKENLIAERIAYKDPTTLVMLEQILEKEEEHASDMHDLLVAHQGRPMLSK
jgi:bacterioferritin